MISDRLDKVIREVPNFPNDGINFKDITPLLLDVDLSLAIINAFIERLEKLQLESVVKIERTVVARTKDTINTCSLIGKELFGPELFLVGLWRHECEREFVDKLVDNNDK